jgi:pSer/pThr/pTyr-binding forkhead associated (FHA) protein
MSEQRPVLVGIKGMVQGEEYPLEHGESLVIGRSRECDVSLRDCKRWQEAEDEGRSLEEGSKTVSRKHLKISFHDPDSIELEDLSSNGTFVDGKRIDRMVISDLRQTPHEVTLGAGEKFRLEWK